MLDYDVPVFQRRVQDHAPDYILAGGQAKAAGISSAFSSIAGAIGLAGANKIAAKDETAYLTAKYEGLAQMAKLPPEQMDKFYSASLGAKRGTVSSIEAQLAMARQDQEFDLRKQHQNWADSYHPPQLMRDPRGGNLPPVLYNENGNIQDLPPLPDDGTPPPTTYMPATTPDGSPAPGGVVYAGRKPMGTFASPTQGAAVLTSRIDPATGMLGWYDGAGRLQDPAKLKETEEIPGTAQPGKTYPMPPMPGIAPGMTFETPGTPAQRRVKPQPPPPAADKTIKPGPHFGPNGNFYVKPDGRVYELQGEGKDRKWVLVPGIPEDGNILLKNPGDPNPYENGNPTMFPTGGDPNSPAMYSQPPTGETLAGKNLLEWLTRKQ